MKTLIHPTRQFEFCFPQLDTLLLVEEQDGGVVILATKKTFSERRKACFIRQLAAEGFISDSYRWFSDFGSAQWLPVRWLVDALWLRLDEASIARTRRFMVRLLAGVAMLWLGLMLTLALL